MELLCFVAGLLLGVVSGIFCISMMKVASDSDGTVQDTTEKHKSKKSG